MCCIHCCCTANSTMQPIYLSSLLALNLPSASIYSYCGALNVVCLDLLLPQTLFLDYAKHYVAFMFMLRPASASASFGGIRLVPPQTRSDFLQRTYIIYSHIKPCLACKMNCLAPTTAQQLQWLTCSFGSGVCGVKVSKQCSYLKIIIYIK